MAIAEALHIPKRETQIADPKTGLLNKGWLQCFLKIGEQWGLWRTVDYAAGLFTASGAMSWTVAAGDLITLAYVLHGKRLEVAVVIRTATVGGVVSTQLRIALPAGFVAARDMTVPVWVTDNGTKAIGVATVSAGGTVIAIEKVDGSNWTLATNANGVEGVIALEVR